MAGTDGSVNPSVRMHRLLVVDNNPVLRTGIVGLLNSCPGIQVVGEASSIEEADRKSRLLDPDVVITDLGMLSEHQIGLTCPTAAGRPLIGIFVFISCGGKLYVMENLDSGEMSSLEAVPPGHYVVNALTTLAEGSALAGTSLHREALSGVAPVPTQSKESQADSPASGLKKSLTARENDVLVLLRQGCSNREIAQRLYIAEITAKKHVQNIIGKMGARNRTQAAIMAEVGSHKLKEG